MSRKWKGKGARKVEIAMGHYIKRDDVKLTGL